jgi:beta-glucosidase
MTDFPPDFLFGSATSAHQVEGGNVNSDWWDWEHRADSPCVEPSGDAIDQYHRYAEDFRLLGELGHDVHRLSVEWARVEPARGEFSQAAIGHYRRVLSAVVASGMTPMVTLHHFTLPRWFAADGGWLGRDAIGLFRRYCHRVIGELGDLAGWFCTINEPQVLTRVGYLTGMIPPGVIDPDRWQRARRRLIEAHEAAVEAVHAHGASTPTGLTLSMAPIETVSDDDAAKRRRAEMYESEMDGYLRGLAGDFVGVQYYAPVRIDPALQIEQLGPEPGERSTLLGQTVDASGLYWCLERAASVSALPVFVTENGIATHDDSWRVEYMHDHVQQARRAIEDGIDLRGFLYWSAFDNFEWIAGYEPTFGLIGVDRADGMRRVVKDSARWWESLCRTHRIPPRTGLPDPA